MRLARLIGAIFVVFAAGAGALAAEESPATECGSGDPDTVIAACSRIIDGGSDSRETMAVAFFYRAHAHARKGDRDRAIADFSETIRFNDRNSEAYRRRGNLLAGMDDFPAAFADLESALALEPDNVAVLAARGFAHFRQGDAERAIADYTAALRVDPKDVWSYRLRGIARLASGAGAHAEADFRQAALLEPSNAYVALWFEIAARRNGIAGRLDEAVAEIDRSVWPGPIVDLFRGQLSREAVFAAAADAAAHEVAGRIFEATFFAGELALVDGDRDEGRALLERARTICPSDYVERTAAGAELAAMAAR